MSKLHLGFKFSNLGSCTILWVLWSCERSKIELDGGITLGLVGRTEESRVKTEPEMIPSEFCDPAEANTELELLSAEFCGPMEASNKVLDDKAVELELKMIKLEYKMNQNVVQVVGQTQEQ